MPENVLIPESFLAEKDDEIKELVKGPAKAYAAETGDASYGKAFRRSRKTGSNFGHDNNEIARR